MERRAVFNSVAAGRRQQVWIIAKAKAAAIGAGLPVAEPLASMVCDVGGGNTEVAVLSLAQTVAAQSIRTGGDHMDRAIVDYLRRHYSLRDRTACRRAAADRHRQRRPLEEELVAEVSGVDTASGLPRKATVTSEEVRQALGDPLEAILEAVNATLDQCSPDLAADLVDHGMVLCGGGALLRRLDRFLAEQTGPAGPRGRRAADTPWPQGCCSAWSTSPSGGRRCNRATRTCTFWSWKMAVGDWGIAKVTDDRMRNSATLSACGFAWDSLGIVPCRTLPRAVPLSLYLADAGGQNLLLKLGQRFC